MEYPVDLMALALAVFVAGAALDALEAYYVRAVADAAPHRAATFSVLMYGIGCVGYFAALEVSYWLLVPEVAGLYVGSALAIRRQRRARGLDAAGARAGPAPAGGAGRADPPLVVPR
jgi:hypothetical protein